MDPILDKPAVDSRRMKVLVVDEECPWPCDSGKRLRSYNLLKHLAQDHDLTLACFPSPIEANRQIERLGITVVEVEPLPNLAGGRLYGHLLLNLASPLPYSVQKYSTQSMSSTLLRLLGQEKHDLVHFETTLCAEHARRLPGVRTVLGTHNIEATIWARRAAECQSVVGKPYFAMQAKRMATFEQSIFQQVSAVTCVSDLEARQAEALGAKSVTTVPNGVDLEYFDGTASNEIEGELLFVGSLDWFPNVDAVNVFLEKVFPTIRAKIPGTKLTIVGRRPPAEWAERIRHTPSVQFVGEVEDVRTYLRSASLVVVPLQIGGGSRIKILEALAMQKAIVSTPIGAEGLDVSDGRDLCIAELDGMASAVIALLGNPEKRRQLGRDGRVLVERSYSWQKAARKLDSVWRRVSEDGKISHSERRPEIFA